MARSRSCAAAAARLSRKLAARVAFSICIARLGAGKGLSGPSWQGRSGRNRRRRPAGVRRARGTGRASRSWEEILDSVAEVYDPGGVRRACKAWRLVDVEDDGAVVINEVAELAKVEAEPLAERDEFVGHLGQGAVVDVGACLDQRVGDAQAPALAARAEEHPSAQAVEVTVAFGQEAFDDEAVILPDPARHAGDAVEDRVASVRQPARRAP